MCRSDVVPRLSYAVAKDHQYQDTAGIPTNSINLESVNIESAIQSLRQESADSVCRSDVVPRLSYASVEGIFMELVSASPVRRAANDVKNRSGHCCCALVFYVSMYWFAY